MSEKFPVLPPQKKDAQKPLFDPKIVSEIERQQTAIENCLDSIADSLEVIAMYYQKKGIAEKILTPQDFEDGK